MTDMKTKYRGLFKEIFQNVPAGSEEILKRSQRPSQELNPHKGLQ
jgi:hypothetical protein